MARHFVIDGSFLFQDNEDSQSKEGRDGPGLVSMITLQAFKMYKEASNKFLFILKNGETDPRRV